MCPSAAGASSGTGAVAAMIAVATSAASAAGSAVAGGGARSAPCGRSKICTRPPSTKTAATAGAVTPAGADLLDQRQCLVGGDRRIPFGNALVADPQAHPAHLLVGHVAFGQLVEVVFGLLVGRVVAARVRDLGQHGVAVVRPIKAETLGLREKKPADSDGSNVWVLAIGRRHPAFPRCVARGAFPDRVAWVGRNRRTFGIRGAVPRPACAPGVPGRCRASSRTGRRESRPRGLRVASASYPTRAPWVPRGGRRGF